VLRVNVRSAASRALAIVPPSVLGALASVDFIIPYYHIVSDEDVRHVKHLYAYKSVRQFTADLDFISRHYQAVSLADLLDHIRTGRSLPARSFLLTFDDGFRQMNDVVADILVARGVSATFFVNSAFVDNRQMSYLNKASVLVDSLESRRVRNLDVEVRRLLRSRGIRNDDPARGILSISYAERDLVDQLATVIGIDFDAYLSSEQPYLTKAQIRSLIDRGFSIGGHSIDHPLYASLSLHEQLRQTIESVQSVRETYDLSYGAFAFPHTDRNVTMRFFRKLSETALVDVSFGTNGMLFDEAPNHFQRFSLEKPLEHAARIVNFQLARRLTRNVRGRSTVRRD